MLGPENDTFDIEVRYVGERAPAATTETVIENAVRRWERIIAENGATSGLIITSSQWKCRNVVPPFGAYVDDLLIYVYLQHLDGPAGRGWPCFVRSAQADGVPGLAFIGAMGFDPKYLSADSLYFTALHEIGHVLGFGTLWDRFGYLQDPAAAAASRTPDTHFSGELASAAFNHAGGASYRGAKVPVENDTTRYPGAADLHWRESVFGDELMTGGVRGVRGTFEPLSSVTVASLADLGYAVNYAAADAFRLPRPASTLRDALQPGTIHFRCDTFPEPGDGSGAARQSRPRPRPSLIVPYR